MPAPIVTTADLAARASQLRYLEWGPIIAGALGAAAIAFVLLTFGSALGLSAVSPYPYRGVSATTFFIIAGLYAVVVQVASYAAGGYLAGRMRTPWGADVTEGERHFRDGAHGFAVWALGLVFTAAVLASGVSGALKTAVEATSNVSAGAAAGVSANPANALTRQPVDYATDLLLRPGPAAPDPAAAAPRAAVAPAERDPLMRVFARGLETGTLADRDRAYLTQVVMRQTGLPQADAQKRVDEAYAEAKAAEQKVRDAANEARKKTALAAFVTAATLAVACAAACVAAGFGGADRDARTAAYWMGATRFW